MKRIASPQSVHGPGRSDRARVYKPTELGGAVRWSGGRRVPWGRITLTFRPWPVPHSSEQMIYSCSKVPHVQLLTVVSSLSPLSIEYLPLFKLLVSTAGLLLYVIQLEPDACTPIGFCSLPNWHV